MSATGEHAAIAQVLAADTAAVNGDDAAPFRIPGGLGCVTTDTAVEGVHLHSALTPWQMGYRAAACALSDLAAMAAVPEAVTCSISVPAGRWHEASVVAAGVDCRTAEAGGVLAGGDMVAAAPAGAEAGRWSITVTCIGAAPSGRLVLRSGARPGHAVYVTGYLGDARAARALLDGEAPARTTAPLPVDRYVNPPDRLRMARALAPFASAMIDISDGVASDARRIADRSGCGVQVDLDLLPVAAQSRVILDTLGDALEQAATAGDDYELLVTMPEACEPALRSALLAADPGVPLTRIGTCTADMAQVFTRRGTAVRGLGGYAHGAPA